jgi:hypothetical protein
MVLVKAGVDPDILINAAGNYAASPDAIKEQGQYCRGAQVFLGPQKFWEPYTEDDVKPQAEYVHVFHASDEDRAILEGRVKV